MFKPRRPQPKRSAAASGASLRATPRGATAPATAADAGTSWAHTARFLITASKLDEVPVSELPEVAFVGRSNAGKSTAINTLAQQKRLAFASKTPGRTQHINLFALGPKNEPNALWADLPGYGYAAVERDAKLRWQVVMADYLAVRRALSGVVLMVDSRLGFTDLDVRLLNWIGQRVRTGEVKLLVLLTKADKLNRQEADRVVVHAQEVLADFGTEASDIAVTLFSALKKTGVKDVANTLHGWMMAARPVSMPPGFDADAMPDPTAADAAEAPSAVSSSDAQPKSTSSPATP